MAENIYSEHTLKIFDLELAKLRHRIVKMGTLVQQQLDMASSALFDRNSKLIELIYDLEKKVDKLDIKIDKQCMKIFALHQPVAMDLRLVLSSVSINDYFELIGDLVSEIANLLESEKIDFKLLEKTKIKEIFELVNKSFANVLDTLMLMDTKYTVTMLDDEKQITELHQENLNILSGILKSKQDYKGTIFAFSEISKNLKFIGRQIRTIGQELVFLHEARIVKHLDNLDQEFKPEDLLDDNMV